METIDHRLQQIQDKVEVILSSTPPKPSEPQHWARKKGDPSARYNMGHKTSVKFTLRDFMQQHQKDPATSQACINSYMHSSTVDFRLTRFSRYSGRTSKIFSSQQAEESFARGRNILTISGTHCTSKTTQYSHTPVFDSTIQHTMFAVVKTLLLSNRDVTAS